MDVLFNDFRIWLAGIGTVLAALITKIVSSYEKYFDMLFKQNEKLEKKIEENNKELLKKIDDLEKEIVNTHTIISGHLKYHQGMKNGKK